MNNEKDCQKCDGPKTPGKKEKNRKEEFSKSMGTMTETKIFH